MVATKGQFDAVIGLVRIDCTKTSVEGLIASDVVPLEPNKLSVHGYAEAQGDSFQPNLVHEVWDPAQPVLYSLHSNPTCMTNPIPIGDSEGSYWSEGTPPITRRTSKWKKAARTKATNESVPSLPKNSQTRKRRAA
jgi:hypothetical protein